MAIRQSADRNDGASPTPPPETALAEPAKKRSLLPELTALSIRDYRFWWASSASVLLNQFMTQVSIAWLILDMTDSAGWVSGGVFGFRLPTVVLGLLA